MGLSKGEVRRLLGEPEDCSETNRKTEIWKYGGLEIAFDRDTLNFIGLYVDGGSVMVPGRLSESREIQFDERSVEDVERFLQANRIDFSVDQKLTFDEQIYLRVTQTQIGICFVKGELHSIQLTR